MEEVDGIIIDSLKNLHCEIDENITSLKEFTTDMVTSSIASCLEAITLGASFAHKLPPSMSLRLKYATNIAEHIKDLGYRGDMGYQTILYCNEVEIRRVLMFLVERLPRETNKSTPSGELGYVPRVVKEIEERLKLSMEKPWVPSSFLKWGIRECRNMSLRQDFGHCYPLETEHIEIPNSQKENCSEALKQYWVHYLPDVTRQCSPRNLIPSLLFKDCEFSVNINFKRVADENIKDTLDDTVEQAVEPIASIPCTTENNDNEEKLVENKIEMLLHDIEDHRNDYKELHAKRKILEAKLAQITEEKNHREAALKETILKINTKSKTLTVLSNEENMTKLKTLVDNGSKRLIELANQWNQIQVPLLEQYRELQHTLRIQETKALSKRQKLQQLKEKDMSVLNELKDKEKLEQQLLQEYEKSNKNTNRSAYTRRILEIIGNIKKQNEEIQKVLKDTKAIQKEINNLNGQLDRSFTLSDELIFRDAKRDEMARKAYKLLVTLHNDCSSVVQTVTDLGLIERECRNLEEQVDAELAREVSDKLNRVNADLVEVKNEIALLLKK